MRPSFPSGLEAAYQADYAQGSLSGIRVGLILGAIIFAVFAVLDLWMLPLSWPQVYGIRFAIIEPASLAVLGMTYVQSMRRHLLLLVTGLVVCLGYSMLGMIALAEPSEPGFRYYYAGLMLLLMSSFTVVRLPFRQTLICCIAVIAGYQWVAIFDQGLLADGLFEGKGPELLNNNFFLVTSGCITVIGAYILEGYSRTDFLQRSTIQSEKATVEEQNHKITQQRNELAAALDDLKATQTQLIQAERTAAIGNMVAGLLHELNTPAGVIQSATDVMARGARRLVSTAIANPATGPVEAQRQDQIATILEQNATALREAAARIKTTLTLLKRFTRLDETVTADYDVHGALDDCLQMLDHQIQGRIAVHKRWDDLPAIHCRPAEINHVFLSVLQNAVNAIQETGRIELTTSRQADAVRVEIADTGVGIAGERLHSIFEPQFQKDQSRIKLGLGLPTSQQIILRHGGSMSIESELGQGCRVSVRLPIAAAGAVEPGSVSAEPSYAASNHGNQSGENHRRGAAAEGQYR